MFPLYLWTLLSITFETKSFTLNNGVLSVLCVVFVVCCVLCVLCVTSVVCCEKGVPCVLCVLCAVSGVCCVCCVLWVVCALCTVCLCVVSGVYCVCAVCCEWCVLCVLCVVCDVCTCVHVWTEAGLCPVWPFTIKQLWVHQQGRLWSSVTLLQFSNVIHLFHAHT